MPVFFRSKFAPYLPFFLLIFFLGLVLTLVYVYVSFNSLDTKYGKETITVKKDRKELSQEEIDSLAEKYPLSNTVISDKCLIFPDQQQVVNKNVSWERTKLLTEEKYKLGKVNFFDIFINAQFKGIEQANLNNCQFYKLSLLFNSDNSNFELYIPKGADFTGKFKGISADFLKEFPQSNLGLRVQFYSKTDFKTKPYKFVEWEIVNLKRAL